MVVLGWLVNAYSRHFVDGGGDRTVQAPKVEEVGPQSHKGEGEGGEGLWVERGRFYN